MRIGLIGCGNHGRNYLSKALKAVEEAELVACADLDESAAYGAAQEWGYARAYQDYGDMLSREELDGVVVALPHYRLKDAAIASIQAGRSVFVEKPVCVNRAEAMAVREAAREAGVTVMAGYCVRLAWSRSTMKAMIDKGAVGEIVQVSAGKGTLPLSGWARDPKKGGGPLLWVGVHITDQVLWMVGSEPERVYGEIQWHPETGADQNTAYTVRFKSDVIANVVCSQQVHDSFDFIDVVGTAGRLRSDWPSNILFAHSEVLPEYSEPTTMRPNMPSLDPMYQREMQGWVTALREGREPPITIDDGIKVLSVVDAVFESARTGSPVLLD